MARPEDGLTLSSLLSVGSDSSFTAAMDGLMSGVDSAVSAGGWVCGNRGLCCDFSRWGHRLYVTTAEVAYFVGGVTRAVAEGGSLGLLGPTGGACPYHRGGGCVARRWRPVGCRLFFCDGGSDCWQGEQYERLKPALVAVGSRFGLAYRYMEWLGVLGRLAGGVAG